MDLEYTIIINYNLIAGKNYKIIVKSNQTYILILYNLIILNTNNYKKNTKKLTNYIFELIEIKRN